MEKINKNLAEIRAEFYRNKRFIGQGYHAPPVFELKGYDDEPNLSQHLEDGLNPGQKDKDPVPTQANNQPVPENKQPEPPGPPEAEATGAPEPEPPAPPPVPQTSNKIPRALSRINSSLDGINWSCNPLPGRRRFIVSKLDLYQTPGEHYGTHENTELVPDDETGTHPKEKIEPEPGEETKPPPRSTEKPEQEEG